MEKIKTKVKTYFENKNKNKNKNKEKTIEKIHEEHISDIEGRDEINDWYIKIYTDYLNLIENNNLDIKREIAFIKLKMNRYGNEMLNYYMNFFSSILSGVSVAMIAVYITSDDILKLLIGFLILIGILYYAIMKNSKFDIKEIYNEKKYYSVCLLVLNDLEEEYFK